MHASRHRRSVRGFRYAELLLWLEQCPRVTTEEAPGLAGAMWRRKLGSSDGSTPAPSLSTHVEVGTRALAVSFVRPQAAEQIGAISD